MPVSYEHEAPLELCRQFPELIPTLLRDILGIALPPFSGWRLEDSNFTQPFPKELRADSVFVFEGSVPTGVILELQRTKDLTKHRSWPLYTATLHARLGGPSYLLVLALSRAVAAWARQPIETFQPGHGFVPLVIGPDEIPAIRDFKQARQDPALAALSALVHANDPGGAAVVINAVEAMAAANGSERALWLFHMLREVLDHAILIKIREALMQYSPYFPRDDFEREHFGRGVTAGKAEGVLTVLGARGVPIDDMTRARIMASKDLAQLDRWLLRAAIATQLDDLFRDE